MIFKYKELTSSVFPEAYLRGDEPDGAPPWLAEGEGQGDYDPVDCKPNTCGADTGANCAVCTVQVTNPNVACTARTNCNVTCGNVTDCTACNIHTPPPPPKKDRQAADLAFLQEQVRQVQALGL
ncbi:MAG TPA: hypothetical protein VHQ90_01725 [Thermoanaerobaculia bacterium]|nr:hypothetical protein [Thermoanaerobaculia bacterium]